MEFNLYSEFYFQVSGYHLYDQEISKDYSVIWLDGDLIFLDKDIKCRVPLNLLILEDLCGFLLWLNEVEKAIISGISVPPFEFAEPMIFQFLNNGDEHKIYLEFRTLYEDENEHKFVFMSVHSDAYRRMKRLLLRDIGYFSGSIN
jgi:hypothetical protein